MDSMFTFTRAPGRGRGRVTTARQVFLRRVLVGLAAVAPLAVSAVPAPAAAMTVLRVSLPELVKTSAMVLHAKVLGTRVRDRRAQGLAVFTETTLHIIEVYKGDTKKLGKTFSWEMVGGTAGGLTWTTPGMPTFTAGEEVVVLLEKHARGYTLTGAPQGKYSIVRDAKGVAYVRRRLGDVHFMQRDPKTGRITTVPHAVKPMLLQPPRPDKTLKSLRAEIRAAVVAQTASKPNIRVKSALIKAKLLPRKTVGRRKP